MLLSLLLILLIKGVFSFCGSNPIASQANLLREVPSMKIFDWKKREAFKTLELPEDYEAKVNTIFPIPGSRKKFHRVGRGISAGQGGSCGRGMKGQNSRSGGGVRLGFEGGQTPLARRFPKVRTMRGHIKKKYELIKFSMLNTMPTGSIVHAADLRATGVLTKPNKGRDQYKVVGGGEALTAKGLTVRAHAFTTSARAAIESLGGQCTVLSPTRKNLPLEEAVEQEEELKRERLEKLKAFRLLKQSTLPKKLLWPKH